MWLSATVGAAFFWAFSSMFDSILVNRYEKDPMTVMWFMALTALIPTTIMAFALKADFHGFWLISAATVLSYVGDMKFYDVIQKVDISLTNAIWAILTVYLTIIGFVAFGETWTWLQAVGAALTMAGIFLLAYLPAKSSDANMLPTFAVVALPYLPYWIVQKYLFDNGAHVMDVFVMSGFSWAAMALVWPLFFREKRASIRKRSRAFSYGFCFCQLMLVFTWAAAQLLTTYAYESGPLSLVSITANVQPFFAILIAAIMIRIVPRCAPKELLTAYSVKVKVISFAVMFVGLAFLSLS